MRQLEKVNYTIKPYQEEYRTQLLSVWENSVRATHTFLSLPDFQLIRSEVHSIDFNALDVHCLLNEETVIGFIGVADRKVEMLFISPDYFGKGLGKKLMDVAISGLKIDSVDVNEQNNGAVVFYTKLGFEVYERTVKDDQGRDYPLLRMRLSNKSELR